ncbi:DUF3829 domain-containing protein [Pseudomonas sp. rhizo66]|uniref:DUF3829 domain-containing protein n=1 Tax=Pseudomonas sp. rhizo66 TaxID=3059674 RepID=UPI00289242BA|nr:DUF3829 domain-containing protein [Pseudomonas sp. rhizo66]MDT3314800.1 DUF3829 domain-containing protein [Pseudomonas sp. rhizo66]
MSSRTMFVSGLLIALLVMGLSGATTPFLQLDLWLDNRDAPVTAQANALSPIITCVNRVDVHWQVAYEQYKNPKPPKDYSAANWVPEPRDFEDSDARIVQDIQKDVCLSNMNLKLDLLGYQPELSQRSRDYAKALQGVATVSMPSRFDRSASFVSVFPNPSGAYRERYQSAIADYLRTSTALRHDLVALDVAQRSEQLKRLDARMGKEIHWSLLAYMIQARETLELLEDRMKHRTLTPQAVADTTADLQLAWNRRGPFIGPREPGFRNKDDDARELWRHINEPAQHYLDALNTLHKDWQDHAEPQRLSDDYYAVTRGYDALLSHYNRQARANF